MNNQKLKVVSNYIYSTSDILGTGTWGTVYLARRADDESNEKKYAIKKMNKFKVEASEKSFLKYQSQVTALQKASSIPQVIKIIDFFKSKSHYYIATEYINESKDLYEYMLAHKNKFCQSQLRTIAFDLLIGLEALHKIGIFHRDLKLQNILYIENLRKAKIIDFGMATCFPNPEGIVGSPMFMSPQVLGNQKYSHKCDIWSLGIIFYCMVYRTSPYSNDKTAKDILQKMKKMSIQGIEFPNHIFISKNCRDLISRCLTYEQIDRPEIKQLLTHAFFEVPEIPDKSLQYYEPCTSFRN